MPRTRSARLVVALVTVVVVGSLASCTPSQNAVAAARSQVGAPYVTAGATPARGFDCSGLVSWAWARAGVTVPRTAAAQYAGTRRIAKADLRPGDLVFYGSGGRVSHVAMFVGDGKIVQARKPGTVVEYQSVDWWISNRIGFGRVGS